MTAPPRPCAQPWPLDYSWAQRSEWKEDSDVLLEAQCEASKQVEQALASLFHGLLEQAHPMVDGTQPGYWSGGVFLYSDFEALSESTQTNTASLWLHSRGQDAFDSLHAVSDDFCRALAQSGYRGEVRWIEHPHNRAYRLRLQPPPTL